MANTPRRGKPDIGTGGKNTAVNDGNQLDDIDVQPAVEDKDLTAPPGGTPAAGSLYIVGAGATGAWSGHDGKLAYYRSGWVFRTPWEGYMVWVKDENQAYIYSGSAWVVFGGGGSGGGGTDLRYNVRDYGAVGDGSTDDSAAIQDAFDDAELTGGIVYFPRGSYALASGVTLDLTASSDDADELAVSIIGDGSGCTEIKYTGATSSEVVVKIQGASGSEAFTHHSSVRGIKFTTATPGVGYGLVIDDGAFMCFEDLFFLELARGFSATDIVSCRFINCRWRYCTHGIDLAFVSFARPNALDFFGCHLGSNTEYGALVNGGSCFNWFGGSIEGNGTTAGSASNWGVKLLNMGVEGKQACLFSGVYFELNIGTADVWIDHGTDECGYAFHACTFVRAHSSNFVTNNIKVDQGGGDAALVVSVFGCSFGKLGTYAANASRLYVNMNCAATHYYLDFGVLYEDGVEVPPLAGTATVPLGGTTGQLLAKASNTDGDTQWVSASASEASVSEYRNNTADKVLTTDVVWSAADYVTLTDAATVAVDLSTGINFTVTLGGNRTLGNPSNTKNGQTGVIVINQDGSGNRTLGYSSNWKFASGAAPTLSTGINERDLLFYQVISSSVIYGALVKDVS